MRSAPVAFIMLCLVVSGCTSPLDAPSDGSSDGEQAVAGESEQAVAGEKGTTTCPGTLYDTHLHTASPAMAERMDEHGVGCGVLFAWMEPTVADRFELWLATRADVGPQPGRYVLFFDTIDADPSTANASHLAALEDQYGAHVTGWGEYAFWDAPDHWPPLDGDPWQQAFASAAKHDRWIMIHPTMDEIDGLDRLLDRHPDVRVLLHGDEAYDELESLLREHANVYFTLDTTYLLVTPDGTNLMWGIGRDDPDGSVVDRFVQAFDEHRDAMLDQAVERWTPILQAAPNRVMWGTDSAFGWHEDPEVYGREIAFTREFIARLPTELQDAYARENAVAAFGAGVTLDPLDPNEEARLAAAQQGTAAYFSRIEQEVHGEGPDEGPCHGGLYDTHLHDLDEAMVSRMDEHDVRCAVWSIWIDPTDQSQEDHAWLSARDIAAPHPDRFVPYFNVMSRDDDVDSIDRATLDDLRTRYEPWVRGWGEYALWGWDPHEVPLSEEPWPTLFEAADEQGLSIWLHPRAEDEQALRRLLDDHPSVDVLVHGDESRDYIEDLLAEHPNLHFTLDTMYLLRAPPPDDELLMYGSEGADAFIRRYDRHRDAMLDRAVDEWRPVLQAAPDRVMWGTDALWDWHGDPAVYDRLIGFTWAFIERLPTDLQEPFAWANAEGLFGHGASLPPLSGDERAELEAMERGSD